MGTLQVLRVPRQVAPLITRRVAQLKPWRISQIVVAFPTNVDPVSRF